MTDTTEMRRLITLLEAEDTNQQGQQQGNNQQQNNEQNKGIDVNNPTLIQAVKAIKNNQPVKAASNEAAALAKVLADIIRGNNVNDATQVIEKILAIK